MGGGRIYCGESKVEVKMPLKKTLFSSVLVVSAALSRTRSLVMPTAVFFWLSLYFSVAAALANGSGASLQVF